MKKNPISELRRLEKKQELWKSKRIEFSNEKESIINEIERNPPKIKEITKEVTEFREKALKNREVKSIMERYKIPISDLALVMGWSERIHRPAGHWFTDGWSDEFTHVKRLLGRSNAWVMRKTYVYGGPQNKFQVIFNKSKNSRYFVKGIIFKFA
jgi:hypothetical protein